MKVQDILTDESKWTKGYYARNQGGGEVLPLNAEAVSFCLLGAIHKAADGNKDLYREIREKISTSLEFGSIPDWNDDPDRTFSEVRALIEKLDI